jgi:hypothetical protein
MMENNIIKISLILTAFLLIHISCQRNIVENVNTISESNLIESETIELSKSHFRGDSHHWEMNLIGLYDFGEEDIWAKLKLNSDYTYSLYFSGRTSSTESGIWRTNNKYLFLERNIFKPYFRLINIEPNQSKLLTVCDIESKQKIMAIYRAQYFWGIKDGFVDSMIVLPKSTKFIQLKCPGYPTVGFSVKNFSGKKIDVFLPKTFTHFKNDSFRIYPDRLFLNSAIIFYKRNGQAIGER